ncbi:S-formylglutathione hydrolase [Cupriavidus alkaliphilus]|uniref:S-formylglutathione hydrolase n=1 Tax=Cupriavidus alkaliphilus TaxID=942866 RepID=UPI000DC5B275|nr:S-formylglutathione hydrolase [Cupriavidus alkaliphilus]RAS09226.1 S-formylglutathione hydrolase [Cupriavidus alkaliphilus]
MDTLSKHLCHGGSQGFYRHQSEAIGLPMRLSVYLPPQAASAPVPAAIYLAGLTCTEETFMIKAGAQRLAAVLGLALVAPDTSPRGAGVADEEADWDLGTGAGFYLDATREPWRRHYRMASYVVEELPRLLASAFPIDTGRLGLFGHSMGGHGALTLGLAHPGRFRSLSAFAPVCAPLRVPWGRKAFAAYLGDDMQAWRQHDACEIIKSRRTPYPGNILVDQGLDDPYLDGQLRPDLLEAACAETGQQVTVRRHSGYDHGYYFISTFIADHLHHHAAALGDV